MGHTHFEKARIGLLALHWEKRHYFMPFSHYCAGPTHALLSMPSGVSWCSMRWHAFSIST